MNRLKRALTRANWFTLLIISILVILPFAQLPFVLGGGTEVYQVGDEVVSLRTENSKTYYEGKGNYRAEISSGVIHYKDDYADPNEPWKDISLEKWDGEYLDTTPYILRVDKKEVSFTDKRTGETTTLKLLNVKPKELEDTFQIIPFNAGVSFQFEVPVGTDFRVKFKITGNATLITRAYDDAGEISLNVTFDEKTGELTESLDASKGKVKDKVTGEERDVKGKIKVDPTLPISSSSKDNYLWEFYPTTNYGTLNTMYVGRPYATYASRGLVEFTIPSYLYGATVDSATMSLYYYYSVGTFSGKTLNAHRLLRLGWSETTSTWNSYKTGSAWTTAGAASVGNDIYGSDIATATVNSGSYGWVSWGGTNMKNQAKIALAASTNVAVRIADNTETTGHIVGFYSREGTYPPKLSIDYTVNAPTVTTSACTNIKPTKVDGNGAITKLGGAYATGRGFCYMEGVAVGWVSPTGGSGWTNSFKAYDDNEATYASSLTPTSSYLTLTHAEMICDKVRIKAADYGWPAEDFPDIVIDVYYESAWHNIWSGFITMGWVEKSIGSLEFVTQARIKFNSTIGEGRIYEFDFNLADPTVDCDVTYEDGTFDVGSYSLTIEDLELGTSYLVRAYGNNTGGIGYGSTVAVTTLATPIPPEVDTDACTDITATTMEGNAEITYDGGATVTRRGFFCTDNSSWLTGYEYRKPVSIDGTTDGAQDYYQMQLVVNKAYPIDLTLLNVRSSKAFTITGGSDWTERDFGTTIPEDTKLALIMVKSTTTGDLNFRVSSTDSNYVTLSLGSDTANFDGSYFVMIPVYDRKCWTQNLGASGSFDVYVVGYMEDSGTGNTFFEMFDQDNLVVSAQNPADWTNVDISSLKVENGDKTIKGAYIAVDSNADQNLYFRASGSSEGGVLWESDTNDPGTHLLGFIPVGSDGIFQYKTGGTNIDIYVLSLIHSCSAVQSDKMTFHYAGLAQTMTADSSWHTVTLDWYGRSSDTGAKVYYITGMRSPGQLNIFKTRPYGSSSIDQSYAKKNSCGDIPILTKVGTDNKVDYWSSASANGYIYCNAMTIYPASFEPTGGYLFIDSSKCQFDFGDLRFTEADGETEMDYRQYTDWDVVTAGDQTAFFIEFTSIPASPDSATYFVYYGNDSVASESDLGSIYLKYDDFEWGNDGDPLSNSGGDITWTITAAGSSKAEIDTAQHYLGTRSARLYRDGTNNPIASFSQTPITATQVINFYFRKSDTAQFNFYHGNDAYCTNVAALNDETIQYYDGSYHTTGASISVDTWYLLNIRNLNWATHTYDIYLNGSLIKSGATMWASASASSLVKFGIFAGTSGTWIDNITSRNWADPEPTWGTWGSEVAAIVVYEDGSFSEGEYSLTIGDLTPSTWYYVWGFAMNSGGIGYGDVVAAQTLVAGHPYSWGYILGA